MAIDFEIIVGTHEEFLLGYKVHNIGNKYNLERSFATHSHLSSIRDVASSKHYLASSAADDCVYLYDMRYRVESGRLMHHNNIVNCLTFTPDASHILTASNDGSIGVVRCGSWQLEKHWLSSHKGHPVNALAVHPTGKLAMSAGGDGVLRTWNLIKGRQAYATNLVPRLKLEANYVKIIRWSPNGEKYLLVTNNKIDIYSVEIAGLTNELSFDAKVICVEFIDDNVIAVGHENGKLRLFDIATELDRVEIEAHDIRVKCLAYRNKHLVSASSSGEIKLWQVGKKKLNLLSRTTCDARVACITLTHSYPDLTVKKEEPIAFEAVPKKKSIFRIRQEVIIEDEESNVKEISDAQKNGKKTSRGKKRAVVEIEEAQESPETNKKIEKKRQSIEEIPSEESPEKKKKFDSSVQKKNKTSKITKNNAATKRKIDETEVPTSKKNKKQHTGVEIAEKSKIPVLNKRNHQCLSVEGVTKKTKKKKIAR